jgi:hypothetical protein
MMGYGFAKIFRISAGFSSFFSHQLRSFPEKNSARVTVIGLHKNTVRRR